MKQEDAILAYLRRGNSLTALEALSLFQCLRLAARINVLKKSHPQIISEKVKTDSGKYISRYSLAGGDAAI